MVSVAESYRRLSGDLVFRSSGRNTKFPDNPTSQPRLATQLMSDYKQLEVWQKAYKLTLGIYMLTKKLPKEELFGLISQIRRAAVSVVSNIAEGEARYSEMDRIRFFVDSRSSIAEVETQLLIIKGLYKNLENETSEIYNQYKLLGKSINSLISYRRKSNLTTRQPNNLKT